MRNKIFVKQSSMYDCGSASLLMIIRHYHGNIPLQKLNEMMHITNKGTTAYNIVKVAQTLGLEAKGYKIQTHDLQKLSTPFIAHITIDNVYKHFIVIESVNNNQISILDPMRGKKQLNMSDFEKIWNNIVITFTKPQTKPIINIRDTSLSKTLKTRLQNNITTLAKIISLFFIQTLISLYLILNQKYTELLLTQVILIPLLNYIQNHLINNLSIKFEQKSNNTIVNDLLNLPYPYYKNHSKGEYLSEIAKITMQNDLSIKFILVLMDMVTLAISQFLLFTNNVMSFYVTTIAVLVTILFSYREIKYSNLTTLKEKQNKLFNFYEEMIEGLLTIQNLNISKNVYQQFNILNQTYINTKKRVLSKINNTAYINILVMTFTQMLILLINNNENTFNIIIQIYLATISLQSTVSLMKYIKLHQEIKQNPSWLHDIAYYTFEETSQNADENSILINNLNFSYDDYKNVLNNINITIPCNEKAILIGLEDSGKTTLLQLIKSYYKTNNMIYVGQTEINKIGKETVTYIKSDEQLFNGTIYSNLDIENNSNEDIKEICNICDIEQDEEIIENGFNITKSKKQKISLARALLKSSKILLLDESLNNLDQNTERKILKKILQKYINKTIIYATNQYSNIDLFDHLIVINNGKIVRDVKKH